MGLHESKEELVPHIWLLLWMEGEQGAERGGEGSWRSVLIFKSSCRNGVFSYMLSGLRVHFRCCCRWRPWQPQSSCRCRHSAAASAHRKLCCSGIEYNAERQNPWHGQCNTRPPLRPPRKPWLYLNRTGACWSHWRGHMVLERKVKR